MSMKARITRVTYKRLMQRSRGRCEWCGSREECGIDHIIPRRLGGGNQWWNLQLLCRRCGTWKGGDAPERVIKRIKRMPVRSKWAEAVKDVGLRKMTEFVEHSKPERPQAKATFDNPLQITLGEGKVACQTAMSEDGAGIVFSILGASHEVGSAGESICGEQLAENQVFLVCRNLSSATVLMGLAQHVYQMLESQQAEQMRVVRELTGTPADHGWLPHQPETWSYRFATLKSRVMSYRYNAHGDSVKTQLQEGTTVRIVMVSRCGDVGITEDLTSDGPYAARLDLKDLSDFRNTPEV